MKRGLSIIEVLIALVIMTAITMSVVTIIPSLIRVNRSAGDDQKITVTAKGFFEGLRSAWSERDGYDAGLLKPADSTEPLVDVIEGYQATVIITGYNADNTMVALANCTNIASTACTPTAGPVPYKQVKLSFSGVGPTYDFYYKAGRPQ